MIRVLESILCRFYIYRDIVMWKHNESLNLMENEFFKRLIFLKENIVYKFLPLNIIIVNNRSYFPLVKLNI